MLCAGIAVIAACLLVPLAEENHQLVYQSASGSSSTWSR